MGPAAQASRYGNMHRIGATRTVDAQLIRMMPIMGQAKTIFALHWYTAARSAAKTKAGGQQNDHQLQEKLMNGLGFHG